MSEDFIRTSLKAKPLNKIQQTKPQESRARKLENGIALKMARIVSKFKTRTIAYSTLQRSFAKIGHSTHIYMHLVFTKSVDSNFRAFWLAPVTRNILGYPLFCNCGICGQKNTDLVVLVNMMDVSVWLWSMMKPC